MGMELSQAVCVFNEYSFCLRTGAGGKDRVGARPYGRPLCVRSGRLFCGLDRKCA